jgi:hypothetical protein
LALAVAGVLIAAWTLFFGWASGRLVASGSRAIWPRPAASGPRRCWSCSSPRCWSSASGREARRFAGIASGLARAVQLHRLGAINTELALARDFIAAQARDLDALGRMATDRLSTHAENLRGLIQDNGAQVAQSPMSRSARSTTWKSCAASCR